MVGVRASVDRGREISKTIRNRNKAVGAMAILEFGEPLRRQMTSMRLLAGDTFLKWVRK